MSEEEKAQLYLPTLVTGSWYCACWLTETLNGTESSVLKFAGGFGNQVTGAGGNTQCCWWLDAEWQVGESATFQSALRSFFGVTHQDTLCASLMSNKCVWMHELQRLIKATMCPRAQACRFLLCCHCCISPTFPIQCAIKRLKILCTPSWLCG